MNSEPSSFLPLVLTASSSDLQGQPELVLSGALYLLSSMAAAGPSKGRCKAVIEHLDTMGQDARVPALLRSTCAHLARQWDSVVDDLPTETEPPPAGAALPVANPRTPSVLATVQAPEHRSKNAGLDGPSTGEPPSVLH